MQAAQDKTKGGPGGEKLWSRRIASWFLAWRWLEGNRATGPPGATGGHEVPKGHPRPRITCRVGCLMVGFVSGAEWGRSEEHTSELQSRLHLVCRLLLEKKKNQRRYRPLAKLTTVVTKTTT